MNSTLNVAIDPIHYETEAKKQKIAYAVRNLITPDDAAINGFRHSNELNRSILSDFKAFKANEQKSSFNDYMFDVLEHGITHMFLNMLKDPSQFDANKFIIGNGVVLPSEISTVFEVITKNGAPLSTIELALYCNKCIAEKFCLPTYKNDGIDRDFLVFYRDYVDQILKDNYSNRFNFRLASHAEYKLMEKGFLFLDGICVDMINRACDDKNSTIFLIQYDEDTLEIKEDMQEAMQCQSLREVHEAIDFFTTYQEISPNNLIRLGIQV
ncbi:hypothetical protein MOW14_14730 (plasmid) [Acinetobacter indicus]|uniref:hypothetical protein n=1 Tax=Acinetobacter indicus TaxID=756892 RepID=UPI001FA70CDE|nr:hypothetical protein [Acinetobacter indicus]UNW11156.1 hypothetical protein MOW14_14730 [Acinetobacter indicus]